MSLEPMTPRGERYAAQVFAQQTLEAWEPVFAAETVSGDVRQPLLGLCALYGVNVPSTEVNGDPINPRTIWEELRPALEKIASRMEAKDPPGEPEAQALAAARAKVSGLLPPIQTLPSADGKYLPPHTDREGWTIQLCAAFGTRSATLGWHFVEELKRLSERHGNVDDAKVNAALAIIDSANPQNPIEACLAAQMVALHWLTMEAGSRALASPRVENVIAVAKVAGAFGKHSETLAKLQGRLRREPQTIHVHKHQHLHTGGGEENGRQPHELTLDDGTQRSRGLAGCLPGGEPPRLGPVRSEDESGRGVRLPSGEREAEVLPARRRSWFGRSEG